MLSQGKKLIEKKRLKEQPLLQPPITVRLKFRKVGTLQYISHLDLQRTILRVINRACIPVWYTKGFNPHAKLVFSTPLSVGAQSEYEFLDIRIDREMSCQEIMERMNRELTDELYITEAYIPNTDFHDIAWSTYEIKIKTESASEALAHDINNTLTTSPLNLTKKTKAGDKVVDIISMINSVKVNFDEKNGEMVILATLSATTSEFLNPEMIITGLKQKHSILMGDPLKESYSILRMSILKADFSLFK